MHVLQEMGLWALFFLVVACAMACAAGVLEQEHWDRWQ